MNSYSGGGDWQLNNPVPELSKDKGDLLKLFEDGQFLVPYAKQERRTAHATLKMLFDLYELSSIQKVTVSKKTDMCFGSGVEISGQGKVFLDNIGITEQNIISVASAASKDVFICGSSFILLQIVDVDGVLRATLKRLPPTNVLPIYDESADKKKNLNGNLLYTDLPVGNDFSFKRSAFEKWKAIGKYPKITTRGKNVFETVFQVNATGYEDSFWGRGVANPFWQYIDYQSANMAAKISQSDVISKLLYILKTPDAIALEESGISLEEVKRETSMSLRSKMTNRGDGEGLGILWWSGDTPPEVREVQINRDPSYSEHMRDECITNICTAHGMSPILLGFREQRSGIGSNILLDTLINMNALTIEPTQTRWENEISNLVKAIGTMTGNNITDVQIKFANPIERQIEILKEVNGIIITTTNAANNALNA